MESIAISTDKDFDRHTSSPLKRKRHSSIACRCCRKLKIRCRRGDSGLTAVSSVSKACDNCVRLGKVCTWPEEDGRKRQKSTTVNPRTNEDDASQGGQNSSTAWPSNSPTSPSRPGGLKPDKEQDQVAVETTPNSVAELRNNDHNGTDGRMLDSLVRKDSDRHDAFKTPTAKPNAEPSYMTLQYYRHLGPTAIAPGHKKVSLKIRHDFGALPRDHTSSYNGHPASTEQVGSAKTDDLLPLFDAFTNLPATELLPQLLDSFFHFYGDNFCFLNRQHLDSLIERGEASSFLICAMSALSSRTCPPEIFAPYCSFNEKEEVRESWTYSLPFLERARTLLMPLLNIPSCDVVAGMLLLSWVDFGDNNEAGMASRANLSEASLITLGLWMFTGMSLRMAQELGLHRERPSTGTSIGQSPVDAGLIEEQPTTTSSEPQSARIGIDEFERSAQILLFWCIFTNDTCLSGGTGRVPSIKRDEISIRLPEDKDHAIVRAGPGGAPQIASSSAFVQMVRIMLPVARSIEYLNTDFSRIRNDSPTYVSSRMDQLQAVRLEITRTYDKIPEQTKFGANFYKAAVKSSQAGPYLLLHLFFYLQIAFLTEKKLQTILENVTKIESMTVTSYGFSKSSDEHTKTLTEQMTEEDVYRNAIRSIVDLLTMAKLIDDRALLTTFYLNQAFFHAACAYIRDMLHLSGNHQPPKNSEPSTFPIPNQASMSRGSDLDSRDTASSTRRESDNATESTCSYLALIAKTNYHFLKKAMKDMTKLYAGAGWVDAVLDQRETGLRDVDLSIVSEKISTFIRLHDLRGKGRSNKTSKVSTGNASLQKRPSLLKVNPDVHIQVTTAPASNESRSTQMPRDDEAFWEGLPSTLFADAELNFDPQAFFDDYVSTGKGKKG